MTKKVVYEAIATLVGIVIGAGIFGIPYVVAKAGLLIGLLDVLLIGIAVLFMNLFLGEVVLRTKGKHQLTGYAEKYLGKTGKAFMCFSMVFGIYGALIAYLIGEGKALSAIFGGNPLLYSLGFFVVVVGIIYIGLKAVKESELWLGLIFMAVILIICVFAFTKINPANLASIDLSYAFLPYGVILFAFLGTAAIPEMREELIAHKNKLKKAIMIGSAIPLVVYLVFAFVVVGVTGAGTTEVATIGLGQVLGQKMIVFGNLFAVFAMATSFIALGLALKQMYNYDYGLNKFYSWGLACFIPLAIFLAGVSSFIRTISIAGSFAGGVTGILVVLMLWKAKKIGDRKPEYKMKGVHIIGAILILVFILGILYQILSLLGLI